MRISSGFMHEVLDGLTRCLQGIWLVNHWTFRLGETGPFLHLFVNLNTEFLYVLQSDRVTCTRLTFHRKSRQKL